MECRRHFERSQRRAAPSPHPSCREVVGKQCGRAMLTAALVTMRPESQGAGAKMRTLAGKIERIGAGYHEAHDELLTAGHH